MAATEAAASGSSLKPHQPPPGFHGGSGGSPGSATSGLHGGMGGSPGSVIQNMMSPPCNVNTEIHLGL